MLKRIIKNRFLQHLFFWCLSFLVLMNVLKVSAEVKTIDLIYAAIFHIPIVAVVYINLRLLFPFFLEKGRYILYSLLILSLIALGSGFYLVLFNKWVDYFFEGYYFIAFYGFWDISLYFAVYLVATSLLRLARGWFRLQEIETERNKAELKALRSQINPHFLFNSLNSIYSLARKNSKEVPEKIVQLSDLLRHIIYDSDRDFIPLEKEMEMIRNYITLQNLRTDEQHKINLQVNGEEKEKMVAPMIILPFVENSFKHGLKGGSDNAFVNILLTISDHKLDLEIANSKGKSANDTDL
ncbi:MAG: sensor histidine kinase, partial [Draconibacterium sp.]